MTSLEDLTWPEAEELSPTADVLVVPVGATEQHGPHLPLSTDTDIATELARRLECALPDAVAAPAIAYGASGEHEGFAGTVSIGQAAVELLLLELGRSASATFGRIVLLSTHGGNAKPVARATARLRREGRDVLAWSPRWSGDAHAGRVETSVMLAIHPERVHIVRAEPGNVTPLGELLPGLVAHGVRAVSPNGVLGDPTGASPQEGERLLEHATNEAVAAIGSRRSSAVTGAAVPVDGGPAL